MVNNGECQYISLLKRILETGEERDGRNGKTKSLFAERLEFDLKEGFPLLTTKRVFWRGVVEELLWFLRGSTDAKELQAMNVHIWDGNTSREYLDAVGLKDYQEGELGPGYGFQWRCFGGDYPKHENGIDQIKYLLTELSNNPHGRRAVLSAWNPKQAHEMALVPCHVLYQFYVGEKGLSCQLYCRSQDVCAGTPFNIASTALLTTLFATLLNIPTDRIVLIAGDTHVYEPHIENAKIQITRIPYKSPNLKINRDVPSKDSDINEKIKWLETLTFEDFEIWNYECHPTLKYEMIA
jgi:thymidylate synthase